jgi:hypothetical protein
MALLSNQARSQQAWKQGGNRALTDWARCFLTMLLKWPSSSRTIYTVFASWTQWRTDFRTSHTLFRLPAGNSTLTHLLILWKNRSVSRNKMRMRKPFLLIM